MINHPLKTLTTWLMNGWILPLLLFVFMAVILVILPMADVVPNVSPSLMQSRQARPHQRVVVFMVDGFGLRKVSKRDTPMLVNRVKRSAFGTGLVFFPTVTASGLRSIFSGHRSIERQ